MTAERPAAAAAANAIVATDSVRHATLVIGQALRLAGIDGAETDARFLVQGILGLDPAALVRNPDQPIGAGAAKLEDAFRRRLAREPVSRILGQREFYGRTFKVTPDVLDPRADTETLVDLVLDIVRGDPRFRDDITIADVGVGSGAIVVTLLAELAAAKGLAIDVSQAALNVAADNARAHGVFERMTCQCTRGLQGITQPVDIIVSNPPYIATTEINVLDNDVRLYDPRLALDGGQDGLQIYREIASDIRSLQRGCWVVLEFGVGQASDVKGIFSQLDVRRTVTRADLGGHDRVVALEIHC